MFCSHENGIPLLIFHSDSWKYKNKNNPINNLAVWKKILYFYLFISFLRKSIAWKPYIAWSVESGKLTHPSRLSFWSEWSYKPPANWLKFPPAKQSIKSHNNNNHSHRAYLKGSGGEQSHSSSIITITRSLS